MTSVLSPRLADRLFSIVLFLAGAGILSALIDAQALKALATARGAGSRLASCGI